MGVSAVRARTRTHTDYLWMITRREIYCFYTEFEIINYLIVSNVRKLFINFIYAQTIIYERRNKPYGARGS